MATICSDLNQSEQKHAKAIWPQLICFVRLLFVCANSSLSSLFFVYSVRNSDSEQHLRPRLQVKQFPNRFACVIRSFVRRAKVANRSDEVEIARHEVQKHSTGSQDQNAKLNRKNKVKSQFVCDLVRPKSKINLLKITFDFSQIATNT
jgi:hypothetical protein